MYSKKIIDERLSMFARQEGWMPQPHTLEQVQEFTAYVDSLITKETNTKNTYLTLKRPLTGKRQKEINHFIENEQAMCALSSEYWESRFGYVCDEKGQIFKFKNRKGQEVFDSVIADFDEKQVSIEILCLDPSTRVLTADLRWVRIDDLIVGDDLVAVDEGETIEGVHERRTHEWKNKCNGTWIPKKTNERRSDRKMRTARVEAKWETVDNAVRFTFDDGRLLVGGLNHIMLSKQKGGSQVEWRKLKDFTIGEEIRWVTKPWGESGYEDGWAGGVMDGEGSMRPRSRAGVEATISQTLNSVYYRMKKYLESRNYNIGESLDTREKGVSSKLGNKDVGRFKLSRMDELFRFIGQTRPSRFLDQRWWEGKSLPGKNSGKGWSKIVSIDLLPKQRLVDIQTSTGTFIAEGFVSHNCLKGRQIGLTTKVALKFIHRMLFIPHTQAVMASVQRDKSELVERMLNTAYNRCPWWLVPRRLPKRSFDNGSILSIQSGMQATGIAQGWTPQLIHISEISLIPNPKETIEEGLLPATHSSPNLFMVFEGTGSGNVGWFPDWWRDQKHKWPLGKARMCPIFIPWPMATDLYPEEAWSRKFPVPGNFMNERLEATRKHVSRCESFIRNTPYLAKVVGKDYQMPIEQQWFWEFEYGQARERHVLQKFAARMPADDFEALTGVHDSVFDIETTERIDTDIYEVIESSDFGEDTKVRKSPLLAYGITGHSIQEKFNPDPSTIDWDREAIRITWVSNRGERYDWEMIPLLPVNEDVEAETMDKLLVYEEPKEGEEYSCGIDTAHGLGKEDEDRTCISLTKKGVNAGYDSQVAEYTSNKLSPAQTVPFAACIAAWYGKKNKDPRGVKFAIEQTMGPGDICQNQLKIMGFNHHIKSFRLYAKKIKDEQKNREGFYSNSVTVPILMDFYTEAVDGGWYKPKSKWHIEELKTLERHVKDGGKDRMEHRQGQHDDRVRAAAMSYVAFHTYDDLAARSQRRYDAPQGKKSLTKGVCTANSVTIGEGWDE